MSTELRIEVVKGRALSGDERNMIIDLCSRAFEEDFEALFETFSDTTHVLGYRAGALVSHAMWVTRWLQVEADPMLRTAYVEAVATDPAHRGRGYATAVMKRVAEEIQSYELGALSPFSVAYYERLGWELWRGPLYIRTEAGLIRTPSDEEVMVLRLPNTPALDLDAALSAEWREGELW
jgi:aminoglycoside 2'-N-acetyltransferase I